MSVLLEGWLTKRAGSHSDWRLRWFVLRRCSSSSSASLSYFTKSKKTERQVPKGAISISWASEVLPRAPLEGKSNVFCVSGQTQARTYLISAKSKRSMVQWMNAIQEAIEFSADADAQEPRSRGLFSAPEEEGEEEKEASDSASPRKKKSPRKSPRLGSPRDAAKKRGSRARRSEQHQDQHSPDAFPGVHLRLTPPQQLEPSAPFPGIAVRSGTVIKKAPPHMLALPRQVVDLTKDVPRPRRPLPLPPGRPLLDFLALHSLEHLLPHLRDMDMDLETLQMCAVVDVRHLGLEREEDCARLVEALGLPWEEYQELQKRTAGSLGDLLDEVGGARYLEALEERDIDYEALLAMEGEEEVRAALPLPDEVLVPLTQRISELRAE